MHLQTCYLHGNTQTLTVTSDAAALGGTASQTAAKRERHNSAAVGGLNVPPTAARSERSERPAAATAAKIGGLRRQNAGFVKPSSHSGGKGGAGGVVRSDKGSGVTVPLRTAERLLERSEPPARKTLAAAWLGATFAVCG